MLKHGFFLRFFERRNQYRYLLKKKTQDKNQMLRELSTCAIRKLNGWNLEWKEVQPYIPIDIVYEPTFDLDKPVFFNFCPVILLACRIYVEKFRNGSKYICHTTARQSYYCNNYFVKSEEKMNQHISVYAAKVKITYSFDNAKIIDYRDNYRYMDDVPFTVYFDFETTTGNAVSFDTKMFIVSYCMIVSFNKLLSFPKIVIYRSFDQNPNEIENISHFSDEYQPFFDLVTLNQLSDAARAVTRREKSTSLAEMFSIKLKFTVDTRKAWFEKIIKQRFVDFFDPEEFETFRDLREEIENIHIPKRRYAKKNLVY